MCESKFEEPNYESKFDDESKMSESKFNEAGDECTELAVASTIFGTDPLVGKLVEFWGKTLTDDISTFFTAECDHFDDEKEHKLIYTKLHKKYEKLVENHLQEFRKIEEISERDMYRRLREASDANELAELVIELVICCAEFECFVDIMKAKRRQFELESPNFVESKC